MRSLEYAVMPLIQVTEKSGFVRGIGIISLLYRAAGQLLRGMGHSRLILQVTAASSLSVLAGCAFSADPMIPKMHEASDISVNSEQLRLRMRGLVDPMSGAIEHAADQIISEASDPEAVRTATEWKARGIPALR